MSVPYWHLHIEKYVARFEHLNAEEFGCLTRLLFRAWRAGGFLPNDDGKLASYGRVSKAKWNRSMKSTMLDFFTITESGWTEANMLSEYQAAAEKIEKKRQAGELGNEAKALKTAETVLAGGLHNKKKNKKENLEREEEYINNNIQPIDTYSDLEVEESTRASVGADVAAPPETAHPEKEASVASAEAEFSYLQTPEEAFLEITKASTQQELGWSPPEPEKPKPVQTRLSRQYTGAGLADMDARAKRDEARMRGEYVPEPNHPGSKMLMLSIGSY